MLDDSASTLRETLLARLRSRALRLEEVARHCGLGPLAIEAFLSGAKLAPTALAALPEILAEKNQPRPVDVNRPFGKTPNVRAREKQYVLNARALKVTVVLDPAEISRLPDPKTPRIELTIKVDGRSVRCDVAAKALRKAKATIAEHGTDGVATIVQGKLGAGDVVLEAGLVAQVKVPKEAAKAG